MYILRTKIFAEPTEQHAELGQPQKTASDLQVEQMRMQRELLRTQRQRQQAQEQERRDSLKNSMSAQKLEQKREDDTNKGILKARKEGSEEIQNTGLFKKPTTAKPPIPMK